MSWMLFPGGVLVLLATTVDLFATVAQPGRKGGFLATRLVDYVWRSALRLHSTWPSHRRLAAAGVTCVVAVPLCWMAALWLGWSLVFTSTEHAVVDARTGEPAGTTSRVYYAGYSLFTSGLGDKLPGGGTWEIATVLATAMGLGLVTLAITYLVPVVQAGTSRRSFARHVTWLGSTPDGIVDRCWRPPAVTILADEAAALLPRLGSLTEQHLTYPVLHYLHSVDVATAFAPRVAALHDAMLIASDHGADPAAMLRFELVRAAIGDLTDSFPVDGGSSPQRDAPERPLNDRRGSDTERDADGPEPEPWEPNSPRTGCGRSDEEANRRSRLRQLVHRDGWDWSAVTDTGVSREEWHRR